MKRIFAFPATAARALARLALAATVVTGLMTTTANAAPFDNGSFETPVIGGSFAQRNTGASIGAWTVASGSVDQIRGTWASADGSQNIDLNGANPGALCQTFDTVVGTVYDVRFVMSRNGLGTPTATLGVFVDANQLGTFGHTAAWTSANPAWEPHMVSFTATTTASNLCFVSFAPSSAAGPAIDDVVVSSAAACSTPPANMVAWLHGDGDATDRTGNGHNGTVGAAVSFAPAYVNQGFLFAGTAGASMPPPPQFVNEVAVADAADLNFASSLTFEAWVKPTAGAIIGRIIDKQLAGGEGNNGYIFDFPFANTGLVRVIVGNAVVNAVTPVPGNVWSHVAATWDGATVKLYVNGVLDNSAARVAAINPSVRRLAIGTGTNNGGNTRFNGLIDELKIYSRALSAAEIQGIVAAGASGTCAEPPTDLGIIKTASTPALPGTTITWTLKVQNFGTAASSGYTVTDQVPASVTNVASSTPGCTVVGNGVTCAGGPIAVGEIDTITITGKAPFNAPTTVVNTAMVDGNGTDPTPDNNSSTSTSSVDYPAGVCRGTPLRLLGVLDIGVANPSAIPCATDTETVLSVDQPIGIPPTLLAPLASGVKAGVITGTSTRGFGLAAATANIAKVDVLAVGLATLSVTAVTSEAKSQAVAGCGTAVVTGKSKIAALKLTVLGLPVFVPIGSNPVTVPLLIGGLYLNQTQVFGSTIIQRALFLDLPGTLLDVVIGETTAGIGC